MWQLYVIAIFWAILGIAIVIAVIRAKTKEYKEKEEMKKNRMDYQSAFDAAEQFEMQHSSAGQAPANNTPVILEKNDDISIYSGKVRLKDIKASFNWNGNYKEDTELIFKKAYSIEHSGFDEGISGCTYSVHRRRFTDVSFAKGGMLDHYPRGYEIRRHADGTEFLFSFNDIPTFDEGDRDWDSMEHIAVYCDDEGINLIQCRHGYEIPRINVYIGLIKSIPALDEWLNLLKCDDRIIQPGSSSDALRITMIRSEKAELKRLVRELEKYLENSADEEVPDHFSLLYKGEAIQFGNPGHELYFSVSNPLRLKGKLEARLEVRSGFQGSIGSIPLCSGDKAELLNWLRTASPEELQEKAEKCADKLDRS